jgi:2-keto-4-pentenoate hydratase/2-oxohepta-3-ene-1,7-dioic acid hydratase in catechol pathway
MRLVSYEGGFGRVEGDQVIPMGPDIVAYLDGAQAEEGDPVALESTALAAPVPWPEKIICIGLNYKDHAAESGNAVPDIPVLFPKFANSVIGPGEPIEIPAAVERPDYEAELGVVIGTTAREVSVDEALDYVAGFVCCNDVSARDLQRNNSGQWTWGKAIDTFLPVGPWIVTPDEVGDPQNLGIKCIINGEVMQDSSTSQMVHGVADIVSHLSNTITLHPGDVIATGTPPGVGFARTPPRWLEEGDEVTIEIENIGSLTNPVTKRPRR